MSQSTMVPADAETKKNAAAVAQKTWQYFLRPNPTEAASFANLDPAQGAGEAIFSVRDDGQVDTYLFF